MSSRPIVIESISAMQRLVREAQRKGERVGLVPTMGALHAGHLSLVQTAKQQCELAITTIFVNPTQFAPHEDLAKYPRTLAADLELLATERCDYVFVPTPDTMYPPGFSTYVDPPAVAQPWEGVCRPVHFRGVTTVVQKLFGIIPADVAFFGQKDFQQAAVIRRMVADLNTPIEIVVCPTVREADGLAMSSRNRYLSAAEREQALALSRALHRAELLRNQGERNATKLIDEMKSVLTAAGITRIEYVTLADRDSLAELTELDRPAVVLIACFVGSTRLIDNLLLSP